jgi:small subunit ribosomal protein S8
MDTLANALNSIKVAEIKGKQTARIRPASRIIREVLRLLKDNSYIEDFDFIDDGKSGEFIVKLSGKINNCRAVKPRSPVGKGSWEKFETRFLPAKGVGLLLVSTSKGIMPHSQAQSEGIGGRMLCYVY